MQSKTLADIIEIWIKRVIIIQFICLLSGQYFMANHHTAPYLNKAIQYEGVYKSKSNKTSETMEQPRSLWYSNHVKIGQHK
ncbi:DUF5359 family protein [Scopulibacillus cellulosilyticus]|uniref:DUF5359 family protein n=1 Tax=Scopulibacillus cellulosilyticus TaxID=2665665 RepID=A0ABW2PWE6_9BACL